MRYLLLFWIFVCLAGCASAPIYESNSGENLNDKLPDETNQHNANADKNAAIETSVLVVHIPKNAKFRSFERKIDGYWEAVEPVIKKREMYLPPGEYQYKVTLPNLSDSISGDLSLVEGGGENYIHAALSPDQKWYFVWSSKADRGSNDYKRERLEKMCMSASSPDTQRAEPAPLYIYEACKELADLGSAIGKEQLGYLYGEGFLVSTDVDKSMNYFQQAHALGSVYAGFRLSSLYAKKNMWSQYKKVVQKLADQGEGGGMYLLALTYAYPRGENKLYDIPKAKFWAFKAAELGYSESYQLMADLAVHSESKSKPDYVEAAAWAWVARRNSPTYISFETENFFNMVENELSPKQLDQVGLRYNELIAKLAENSKTQLCIANVLESKYFSGGDVHIKINNSEQETLLDHQMMINDLPANEHKIYVISQEGDWYWIVDFKKKGTEKICLYYDPELELTSTTRARVEDVCKCSASE